MLWSPGGLRRVFASRQRDQGSGEGEGEVALRGRRLRQQPYGEHPHDDYLPDNYHAVSREGVIFMYYFNHSLQSYLCRAEGVFHQLP